MALAQLDLAAVGIGGVWGGCKKGSEELIDDLAAIRWGRPGSVYRFRLRRERENKATRRSCGPPSGDGSAGCRS